MLKKISLDDIPTIETFTAKFEPYSDFNALSLYCWNSNNSNMFDIENGVMTIKITDYLKNRPVYSVLGAVVPADHVEKLLSDNIQLKMIPESVATTLKNSYLLEEDRDNFDYILDLAKFAKLEGHDYKPQRKMINKFDKHYPDIRLEEIDVQSTFIQNQVIGMTEAWGKQKEFDGEKIAEDVESISKYFLVANAVKTLNFALFKEDKLIGYSLNQAVDQNWTMGLFGCADTTYRNSALFLEHMVAGILHTRGYKYINIQQDTGLEGLRKSKLSYRPVRFLKKYRISKPSA